MKWKLLIFLTLLTSCWLKQVPPAKVEESYAINLPCDDANAIWLRSGRGKENKAREKAEEQKKYEGQNGVRP